MSPSGRRARKQWEALAASIHQLCRVYWGPSDELCQEIWEGSFLQPLAAIAASMETGPDSDLGRLRAHLSAFSDPAALSAHLEEGYVRLFVNDHGGITAPLYASCYEDEKNPQLMGTAAVRMQKCLADLKIHLGDDVREPPDHLSIQLEALYFLMTRQCEPAQPGGTKAAAEFAAVQMLPWVQSFHRRLADDPRFPFFSLITGILLSVLQTIAALRERSQGTASALFPDA